MGERWIVSSNGRRAVVEGRERYPHKSWDIKWWLGNDEEPTPPPGYLPHLDEEERIRRWQIRNPLQNWGKYVAGVYDRNYTVVGSAPVMATTWLDVPRDDERSKRAGLLRGWKLSIIKLGWLRLPFISYTGKHVLWYAGWQWWGFFGFKWNILHSDTQYA